MGFQDVFKSEFIDRMAAVPVLDMVVALVLALCLGLFILLVYKRTYSGVMYSASFGASLVALSLVTTLVILAVSSNVLLSLGMVGALSIVRFRTPVKEPMDIVFLFWCIATGIVLAAGMLVLAVFGCAFIGVVLMLFSARVSRERPYILVVRCADEGAERAVEEKIASAVKARSLKSKTVSKAGVELNYEVRLRDEGAAGQGPSAAFVGDVASTEGVEDAILVSYNGDYLG